MNINNLEHYVRFVFNCSDGLGFSTDSPDHLKKYVKSRDYKYPNERFNIGDRIVIVWNDYGERVYSVSQIEIRDLRYNTDENLYGMHEDDHQNITDKDRFSFMTIFISLTTIDNETSI